MQIKQKMSTDPQKNKIKMVVFINSQSILSHIYLVTDTDNALQQSHQLKLGIMS